MIDELTKLAVDYYLGLIGREEVCYWADREISDGKFDEDIENLSLSRKLSDAEVKSILTRRALNSPISKDSILKDYFKKFKERLVTGSAKIEKVEGYILNLYLFLESKVVLSDDEKLSLSIIRNDLDLRVNNLPAQLSQEDLLDFLNGAHLK